MYHEAAKKIGCFFGVCYLGAEIGYKVGTPYRHCKLVPELSPQFWKTA